MTPHWQSEGVTLYQGDCRAVLAQLPAGSVQTCVTSPPYRNLRDYGTGQWEGGDPGCDHVEMAVGMSDKNTLGPTGYLPPTNAANVGRVRQYRGRCGKCGASRQDDQIGLNQTLSEYVEALVDVFRYVRRVLRDDGTVWCNLGFSFEGKQLCGEPWKVAFALQDDGWILRSPIVWEKPNALPESVRDRPTMDYEMVFLLSKRDRYYFDQDSIREPHSDESLARVQRTHHTAEHKWVDGPGGQTIANDLTRACHPSGRNKRSVWKVATQPLKAIGGIDHYAAFPEKLIEPMIKAGSSERGACGSCGSPFVRETRREAGDTEAFARPKHLQSAKSTLSLSGHAGKGWTGRGSRVHDAGFRPSCTCPPADPVPCVILDPFAGSGRSGVVARKLGRHFIGVDLNVSYCDLARAQISAVQPPLIGATA